MLVRFATFADRAVLGGTALATAVALAAFEVQAHDFWIEPSTFRPLPGAIIAVGLRVGQNFAGDPVPRLSSSIEQFFVRQSGSEQPIGGTELIDPAGWFRADGQATAVIAYQSGGSLIELPADQFEEYLRLEGLERIIDLRALRREREEPGRERFYRYAKALVAGEASPGAATQPLGLAYEIVPDSDPTAGLDVFRGRVLHEGEPLPGALVVAMRHGAPSVRLRARSDSQGAFSFTLPRGGVWLVKSVHMVRAWFFSDADWDSFWATLTFEGTEAPP
jgi:uncharacterized GH25 family protein